MVLEMSGIKRVVALSEHRYALYTRTRLIGRKAVGVTVVEILDFEGARLAPLL
jgi:hypothetical protein